MKNIDNLEIINIQTKDGQLKAILSYQDLDKVRDINNGYDWVEIPINLRDLQESSRGNILIDQSVKEYETSQPQEN